MSLVNYVTNTPQNTNRTILKQLINDEKNKAIYESIEELKKSGAIGYTEGEKYTVIIDPTKSYEKVDINIGEIDKVSDLAPKVDEIIGAVITAIDPEGATSDVVVTENFITDVSDNGYTVMNAILVVTESKNDVPVGMYISTAALQGCTMIITWGNETIHPIDPKFIPGSVLPVVELSCGFPGEDEWQGAQAILNLSESDSAQFDAAAATGLPAIVKFDAIDGSDSGTLSLICTLMGDSSLIQYGGTAALVPGLIFQFMKYEGLKWRGQLIDTTFGQEA